MGFITNNINDLVITKKNDVYVHVKCDRGIAMELSEHFTFGVPGAKFMPSYRGGFWDGKIRLFDTKTNLIYFGLRFELARFAESRGYKFSLFDNSIDITKDDVNDFIKHLKVPLEVRDYQLDAVYHAIKHSRALLVSPTASGKSLMIYCLIRYCTLKQQKTGKKTLLLVPTIQLVSQMFKDFQVYGFDAESNCHMITSGKDKDADKPIYISTWQSVYKMKRDYFAQFNAVFVDEAHLAKAKSLSTIMEKLTDCPYRFGLTGTLDGKETNRLTLSGLFDVPKNVTTTKKLMDSGTIAKLKVNCLVLNHSKEDKKIARIIKTYQEECDYLVLNKSRNLFISKLATTLKGNTLVLFQYVEKHGVPLTEQIRGMTDKEVMYVSGITKSDEREDIREFAEKSDDDVIIVASNGTFSTGINIRNIHNIIFAFPSKSQIRILQSIGRGLRTHDSKDVCNVYDIADDIKTGKRKNYTMNHFDERCNIYRDGEFNMSINVINI